MLRAIDERCASARKQALPVFMYQSGVGARTGDWPHRQCQIDSARAAGARYKRRYPYPRQQKLSSCIPDGAHAKEGCSEPNNPSYAHGSGRSRHRLRSEGLLQHNLRRRTRSRGSSAPNT